MIRFVGVQSSVRPAGVAYDGRRPRWCLRAAEEEVDFSVWSIRQPDEPVSQWLDRITPRYRNSLDCEDWDRVAKVHPVRIGESADSWIGSWPDRGTIWDCR